MGSIGAYWGMDFGLGSRGYQVKEKQYDYEASLIAHNIQVSPFTFGWKYGITDQIKIDAHIGAFASFDYTGKYEDDDDSIKMSDWDDWNRLDAGLNLGIGVWYNRLNLDLTYQRGFVDTFKDSEVYASNFMIRLGIAF